MSGGAGSELWGGVGLLECSKGWWPLFSEQGAASGCEWRSCPHSQPCCLPVRPCSEPTSGLDARGAGLVMKAVKNTVATGRTVVCTIHQPSLEIFEVGAAGGASLGAAGCGGGKSGCIHQPSLEIFEGGAAGGAYLGGAVNAGPSMASWCVFAAPAQRGAHPPCSEVLADLLVATPTPTSTRHAPPPSPRRPSTSCCC